MKEQASNAIPKRKQSNLLRAVDYTAYQKQRDEYCKQDRTSNFSSDIELNEKEKELNKLMHAIRETDINSKYVCFVNDSPIDGIPLAEPMEYYPIHPFNEVKEEIEDSRLFNTFRRMPKGGNLHIHTSATLSTEKFIKLLRDFDSGQKWRVFVWLNENGEKIQYEDGTLFLVSSRNECFLSRDAKNSLKGIKNFTDSQLSTYYSFMDVEHTKDVRYIWDEFNLIFSRVSKILLVKDFFMEYYKRAFQELVEDNIDYVELRFGMAKLEEGTWSDVCIRPPDLGYGPARKYCDAINVIWEVYQEFIKTNKDFKLKLIISGSRRKKTGEDIKEKINKALEETYKWMQNEEFKAENFVIGYDLVSEEDRGNSTDNYAKAIYDSKDSKDIAFYFHDGESCWADDDNLYAAVALGTKRVGHGLNLFRFPALVEAIKKHNVALEVCPVSNQLLRYTPDLRMHLIGEYMNRGVECVVCSDDPSILGNGGLVYDFWEVYYSQLIDLKAIKKLIINSYMFSGMTQEEYNIKMQQWEEKWNHFVEREIIELKKENRL